MATWDEAGNEWSICWESGVSLPIVVTGSFVKGVTGSKTEVETSQK